MALLFWGAAHTPGGSGGAVVGSGVAAHQGSWCAGHERVMHFTHTQHHSPARSFSLALARASEQRPSQARAGLRACQARRTRAGTHEAAACRCCRGGARQDGAEPQRGQVDAGRAQALERALAAPGGTKLLCRQPRDGHVARAVGRQISHRSCDRGLGHLGRQDAPARPSCMV